MSPIVPPSFLSLSGYGFGFGTITATTYSCEEASD
jgi:hypothetical protein